LKNGGLSGLLPLSLPAIAEQAGQAQAIGDRSIPAYCQHVADRLVEPIDGRCRKRASAVGVVSPVRVEVNEISPGSRSGKSHRGH